MNRTDPPQSARPAWQPIGEILLPVGLDGSDAIPSLLQEKLAPLQLPLDLVHRIGRSTHEILERAVSADTGLEHLHLYLHVPAGYNPQLSTWGFFRIERIQSYGGADLQGHAVDFYLYPE